jgi:hypothetical protein
LGSRAAGRRPGTDHRFRRFKAEDVRYILAAGPQAPNRSRPARGCNWSSPTGRSARLRLTRWRRFDDRCWHPTWSRACVASSCLGFEPSHPRSARRPRLSAGRPTSSYAHSSRPRSPPATTPTTAPASRSLASPSARPWTASRSRPLRFHWQLRRPCWPGVDPCQGEPLPGRLGRDRQVASAGRARLRHPGESATASATSPPLTSSRLSTAASPTTRWAGSSTASCARIWCCWASLASHPSTHRRPTPLPLRRCRLRTAQPGRRLPLALQRLGPLPARPDHRGLAHRPTLTSRGCGRDRRRVVEEDHDGCLLQISPRAVARASRPSANTLITMSRSVRFCARFALEHDQTAHVGALHSPRRLDYPGLDIGDPRLR